jgi:hypothetical protein
LPLAGRLYAATGTVALQPETLPQRDPVTW